MYPIWYQTAQHHFWYWPVSTGMTVLFSVRTWGYRNVPRQGGLLVVANHQSFLDPVLIGMAVRRRLLYLARKTLFANAFFSWLIQSFGAIPIDQEKPTTEGIRTALELLRQQEAVVIFPEGERTPHGQMQALRPGVTLLVRRGQVPVLPIGIAGAFDVWPRHQPLPRLCPLWSTWSCCRGSGRTATEAKPSLPAPTATSHDTYSVTSAHRGIAVVVGEPIPYDQLKHLSHEAMLAQLTEVLHKVWQEAERRRLKCS
ncbi:1-acyl-sn-glycerol-3-phosphate acyltransferase [bacterium HR36]|uniref:1-acyl-sn-glycerol-3-phosphate acyltransferase n=1 Tax=uncultured Planctomycetota bacterium TaxID=120965 RepID=H5SCE5_9BACT|nr:1-acyl-sn-glycerol-3-phosphate acyltransferase [uncultured Planctomycetota bacterium]GBD37537.1 1-acyl-sn-glycerol-3-phosphate acyltransferase [bacterium HR36]